MCMTDTIAAGRYRHYKGKEYEVLGMATHSETLEPIVIYRALYGEGKIWVRPAAMWNDPIETEHGTTARFTRMA